MNTYTIINAFDPAVENITAKELHVILSKIIESEQDTSMLIIHTHIKP